ncbi:diaminopimelate epimerase [Caldalkalibacillus thermarum]|uniref:diaminopimelate epimerase n=1 Tax=Caldalkalibacillus thermarum TaxID=296745 RepID=UPI00166E63D2|nr:diaminopimelate epimerase [Caldalkalibacillus thermarum]GGK33781.1 diaminopimelate epimerase [Caldalkalibacillus thermarum]
MNIPFTKMQALGNSYVYVDGRHIQLDERHLSPLAQAVSSVRTGIGSDGLILITWSQQADVKMRIFNADGSEAKNCGNGLRCVAKYAFEKGLVNDIRFQIETLGGIVEAHVHVRNGKVEQVTIDMGKPRLAQKEIPLTNGGEETAIDYPLEVDGQRLYFTGVSMGNPHAVFFVDDVASAPVTTLGPKIEKHPLFPEGVNVEFISVRSSHDIDFRVWERGSGQTYACGTGACAAVVASVLKEKIKKGEPVTVHLQGGDLEIVWDNDEHVWMTGPAKYVCEGTYFWPNGGKAQNR